MCGIFGVVGAIERNRAELCLNTMEHRGPDSWSVWQGEGVTLGHRRLSILDLSDNGRQPMTYGDGRYWITFNGEIYNFLELRSDLMRIGYTFRTESDTEVILAAYHAWGENCQNKFNGMWAFAIWDKTDRKLFLSRDRFGKKPLFYATLRNGDFAFASEMKALKPILDDPRPDERLIRQMTLRSSFAYEATDRCLIQGIKRFLAGHCGTYIDGKLSTTRWWNTLDNIPDVPAKYDDQVEIFRELFLDACRIRMRSDVRIGTALSGGLDSSAVLCALAHLNGSRSGEERISNDWQHAYVASFPGSPLDEAQYAQSVAQHAGVTADILHIDPTEHIGNLERMLYLYEDLTITSPIPFMSLYSRIKCSGVTVTLDGHGADELFGGYSNDWSYALLDAGVDLDSIREILYMFEAGTPDAGSQFERSSSLLASYATKLGSALAKSVMGMQSNLCLDYTGHPRWSALDNMGRALFWQTHLFVLPTILRSYDRYGMSASVEIRMPFMDWRIVAFAMALPWSSKIRRGYSKAIVRDAMAPFMPRDIAYRRTKIGFNSPIVDWMKGPLRTFFLDTIGSREFRQCSLVDVGRATKHVQHVLNEPRPTFKSGEKAWWSVLPYFWSRAMFGRCVN